MIINVNYFNGPFFYFPVISERVNFVIKTKLLSVEKYLFLIGSECAPSEITLHCNR